MTANDTTYRPQVQTASGLNILAGIWLFLSAFAVAISPSMMTNNVILGIAVFVLAVIRAFGAYNQGWLSWLNALLGVWVFISPWAVMGANPAYAIVTNNCITGAVIVVLGCWSAIATAAAPRTAVSYETTRRPELGR